MVKGGIKIVYPAEGQEQHQAVVADGHDISCAVRAAQRERLFNADTRYRAQGNHHPFPVCRKQRVAHHVADGVAEGIPFLVSAQLHRLRHGEQGGDIFRYVTVELLTLNAFEKRQAA